MKKTSIFGLNLPEDSDHVDIEHMNENMTMIDRSLKGGGVLTDLDDFESTNANQKIENLEVENNG